MLPQGKFCLIIFSDRESIWLGCWRWNQWCVILDTGVRSWKERVTLPWLFSFSLHPNHQLQSEQELEVLSVLPPGWQPDEPVVPRPFLLVPSTRVTFLAWQYRFVIELDLSPSTGIVVRSWRETVGSKDGREVRRSGRGLGRVKNDLSLPLWKADRCVKEWWMF